MPNAQYFSRRGCANDVAQYKCPMPNTSLGEAAPTTSLSTSAQCPILL
ncbi:hypothetical protein [Nostoc sp.]